MITIFLILLSLFGLYSYALIDPNITLISHPVWTNFRNVMVQLGYHQRATSSLYFIVLVSVLGVINYFATKDYKRINVLKLALGASLISLLSYPFLSHDLFNYLFDAKILTFYHQNPYLHKAINFPADPWLRFMHWTIRVYPYGPTFLPITLVPSFFAFGKFILNLWFFKIMFASFYFLAVYYLNKIDKKIAVFFATQPLIIIEGLINSHNDLLAVSLGIVGVYYFLNNIPKKTVLMVVLSAGIKYLTAPLLLLAIPAQSETLRKRLTMISFVATLFLILFISYTSEIQPWYFLNLLIFLPFYKGLLMDFSLFFSGIVLAYYPFIRYGDWTTQTITQKHSIIWFFFIVNLIYYLWKKRGTISYVSTRSS